MKKLILAILMIGTIVAQSSANGALDKKNAIGGKLGYGLGPSYKRYFGQKGALEVDANFFLFNSAATYVRASAFYLFVFPIKKVEGLSWFVGPGGHLTLATFKGGNIGGGADGLIGIEYKFKDIPLSLSADWGPSVEFLGGGVGFWGGQGGLGIRYAF